MPISVKLAERLDEIDPQLRSVLFSILEEIERQREETITKTEFIELGEIVGELAKAQKETAQGLNELRATVGELATAQKDTERRRPSRSWWRLRRGWKENMRKPGLNWVD